MNGPVTNLSAGHIIAGQPRVVEHCLVGIDRFSFRVVDNDHLGDRVSDPAGLALILTHILLCLLTHFDVSADDVPIYDRAALVTQRLASYENPPGKPIVPTWHSLGFPHAS